MNQALRISLLSLVSCLGISALLVSPALAQIFGSGPSPSVLFDVVVNLPGDEAEIPGGPNENIGAIPFGGTNQLNVNDGGTLGDDFFASGTSEVNISGGTVGEGFTTICVSEVNISGGTVGDLFNALFASEVNISGGTFGDGLAALGDSVVNLSGGTVGNGFVVDFGSVVNISGGTVGEGFTADFGSVVNILGSEFQIDGLELDTLLLDESFTITDRDVTLSGLLADGEQFSLDLNSVDLNSVDLFNSVDFFSPDATLTITLAVPEPSSAAFIALVLAMGFARRRR